jgi:GT2 family glycosyltransferase/FMN phosphatase YigB (HAD superfamily)
MSGPRAHSFDVFDTCLTRTWARPADVLRAAAERVAPEPRAELASELVRVRQQAERAARGALGREAIGLRLIYAHAGGLRELGVEPERMLRAELTEERDAIRPVRAGRERVLAARAAGLRVIFVSDMYLPAAEIRAKLEAFGIARPEDPLYVSGELGITKFTGRLFEHVLRAERLHPAELVHTGDDAVTDELSPARLGIATSPLRAAKLNRFERATLEHVELTRAGAARIAGIGRAVRAGAAPEHGWEAEAAAVVTGAVAPLFVTFVDWVLRTARELGLERLYFVSRDAQVLLGAASELRRAGDAECRYLYGSRQAWLAAGVDAVDPRSLAWLLEPEHGIRTPRALLAKLGIAPDELGAALAAHDLSPDRRLDAAGIRRFWSALEDARPLVLERAGGARDRALGYLEQEGLLEDGRWALVDVGWRLTAQRALRRVLADADAHERILGLYLGVGRNRVPLAESGPFRALVLQDDDLEAPAHDWLFANTGFVEQVFAAAAHGSCHGYAETAGGIAPVLRPALPDPRRDAHVALLHGAVRDVARELAASGTLRPLAAEALQAAALANARLAVEAPTAAEARALGALRVGDDQNETRVAEVGAPLTWRRLARRAAIKAGAPLVHDFDAGALWRAGSLAASPAPVRSAFHGLKALEPAARRARARVAAHARPRRRHTPPAPHPPSPATAEAPLVPTTLPDEPLVSLLLPVYNTEPVLDLVLERLARHTSYERIELIAVDDGSTDGSRAILRRWRDEGRISGFRLIEKENGGAIETLNVALAAAEGDVCVQLDADASIETPGWLERMLALLRTDDRVGAIATRVVLDDGMIHACGVDLTTPEGVRDRPSVVTERVGRRTWHYRARRVRAGSAPAVEDHAAEVDAGLGCCLMYRRADALAAGGYDTGYSPVWFDDIDLCLGIRRLGRKVLYLPDVHVLHHATGRRPGAGPPTAGQRAKGLIKRAVPAAAVRALRGGVEPQHVPSPEQRERLRGHYAYWRRKWGWDPLNPDLGEIERRWGDTEIWWRADASRRLAGEAILAAHRRRAAGLVPVVSS